jgi:hypothetical protein
VNFEAIMFRDDQVPEDYDLGEPPSELLAPLEGGWDGGCDVGIFDFLEDEEELDDSEPTGHEERDDDYLLEELEVGEDGHIVGHRKRKKKEEEAEDSVFCWWDE